jgi:hypothetical protein
MNQFKLQYIYTQKCHKETPCIAILNKQKCHSFLLQNGRTGVWNRLCLGDLVPVGGERMWRKGEEDEYGTNTVLICL